MPGRTWKNIQIEKSQQIKEYLIANGGEERSVQAPSESWRIKFSDSTFTYYTSGTLFSTASSQEDPAVEEAWNRIDQLVGSVFVAPTKEFLVGLDETGKGELIGHTHLVGALIPQVLFQGIDRILVTADTKKSHAFEYWDEIYNGLSRFIDTGLAFEEETIPPWHVDKYNLNKILDVVYQRILSRFLRRVEVAKCRIVIDNYGVGATLGRFLKFLEKRGAEIIIAHRSDDTYLEARAASLIAKRQREATLKSINENPIFKIDGATVGSGNAGNPRTIEWLKAWHASGKPWPWFVKRSFSTVCEIEGRSKAPKVAPPIKEGLLSKEFRKNIEEGKLDIRALSVVCPECGTSSKSVLLTGGNNGFSARCNSCKKPMKDLSFTLMYYCGFVVPDSNVVTGGLIGKDLEKSRFFESFTILLPAVVRYECDTPGGKHEFERLGKFASMGRIKLREAGILEAGKFKALSTQERDDLVIQSCIDNNAMLLSGDNQVKGLATSRDIFYLST